MGPDGKLSCESFSFVSRSFLRVIINHQELPVTIHPLPTAAGRPWRAELLSQLDPRELSAAMDGENPSEWLHAVMASGMPAAQIRLGRLLLSGECLPTDRRAAFACFLSAAVTGDPEAQNLLGGCHDNGWGTRPDREAAKRSYKAAADGGDYRGAHNHGCVLATEGCVAGALHWFEKAVKDAPPPARDAILMTLRHHPRCAIRAFAQRNAA